MEENEVSQRNWLGKLFKILSIWFNVLMAIVVFIFMFLYTPPEIIEGANTNFTLMGIILIWTFFGIFFVVGAVITKPKIYS